MLIKAHTPLLPPQASCAQHLMHECHLNPGAVDRHGMNALMHAAAGGAKQVGALHNYPVQGSTKVTHHQVHTTSTLGYLFEC
jgi:hypothetical protein